MLLSIDEHAIASFFNLILVFYVLLVETTYREQKLRVDTDRVFGMTL